MASRKYSRQREMIRDNLRGRTDHPTAEAVYEDLRLQDPHISPDGKTLIVENIPFDETRDYVDKVEDAKEMYIKLYYS